MLRVSEVLEHAIRMIPCADVSNHASVPVHLVEYMFLPPSFVIVLPCRVLSHAEVSMLFDLAPGSLAEKGVFLRKFLRPNFFSVNLFEYSTIVPPVLGGRTTTWIAWQSVSAIFVP